MKKPPTTGASKAPKGSVASSDASAKPAKRAAGAAKPDSPGPDDVKATPGAAGLTETAGQAAASSAASGGTSDGATGTNTPTAPTPPAGNKKRTYFVRSVPIRHLGEVYGPGFEIDLTDAEAAHLTGAVTAQGLNNEE